MGLEFVQVVATGQDDLDTDIRDLQWAPGPGDGYLYASTGENGGLSVFELGPDGGLTFIESKSYDSYGAAADTGALTLTDVSGSGQVFVGDTGAGSAMGYAVQSDGTPGQSQTLALPGTSGALAAMLSFPVQDGETCLITADVGTGRLQSWMATPTGDLEEVGTYTTQVPATGPVLLADAQVGSTSFVLMADSLVQGVTSFRLDPDTGALSGGDSYGASNGLGINTPTALQSIVAFGQTWVVVGAAGSNSISVLRLDEDGELSATDHVLDTLHTRFANVQAVEMFETDGQVFVLAGGADGGVTLFSLLPDGVLVHRETMVQETGLGLKNINDIEVVQTGGVMQIFVSSASDPGIAQFEMSLTGLGEAKSGSGEIMGSDGDDVLTATGTGPGTDRLVGRKGDDILLAGTSDTNLNGGEGADIFVLRPADALYQIEDFKAGTDRLDLSLFPMLRNPGQLQHTETTSGAQLVWGTTTILVDSHNGVGLTVEDIWGTEFGGPDRIPLLSGADVPAPEGTVLKGTDNGEYMRGDDGNTTIKARDGDDNIWDPNGNNEVNAGKGWDDVSGGTGRDTVYGGKGADSIMGFGGRDSLMGEGGSDTIWGGEGNDYVSGGDGDDRVGGAADNDTVSGGAGRDTLYGDLGDDSVSGGEGDDEAWLGKGNDTAQGDDGGDRMGGGEGNDLLSGGRGNDVIYGSFGNDTGFGDNGDDEIWLGPGQDSVDGGDGADTVGGGDGDDTVRGGAGADEVGGGTGDDVLYGGTGEDTLTGRIGADVFVFEESHGRDVISDFEVGEDLVQIEVPGLTYDDLTMRTKNGWAFVVTSDGDISFTGVDLADLGESDFVFV